MTAAPLLLALAVASQDPATPEAPPAPAAMFAEDAVDDALSRAVAYLLTKQKEDGRIEDAGHPTAMTALAVMALASVGHQPADPTPEGAGMRRALDYVLREDRATDAGYFGRPDGSKMYGHGIVTLMLTELLGMGGDADRDALIRARCERGIAVILDSQRVEKAARYRGGWRYEPGSRDSDLSVTVWQVMALRSAKNDGMDVPAAAIAEAVAYLRRSHASAAGPDGVPANPAAGFCYEPTGRSPTFPMTAAGLLAMQVCGQDADPRVPGAAEYLEARGPKWSEGWASYGLYYYAQGMHRRGGPDAEAAAARVRELLLPKQEQDGSWRAGNGRERGHGKVYATSLSVLSLSVRHHYLPIYQR